MVARGLSAAGAVYGPGFRSGGGALDGCQGPERQGRGYWGSEGRPQGGGGDTGAGEAARPG
jgi:hypothetical protein